MLDVDIDGIGLGHLTVEVHSSAEGRHVAVTAHELGLGNQDRSTVLTQILRLYEVVVAFGQDGLEHVGEVGLLSLGHFGFLDILLTDKLVYRVCVHTGKCRVGKLGLQQVDEMGIELAVEEQDIVALVLGCLDILVLGHGIGGVEVYHLLVLVSLGGLYGLAVIVVGEELTVGVLHQGELEGPLAELLLGQHAVLYEELEVVPLLLVLLAVVLEDVLQAVSHFLSNVSGYLLDVGVGLQITPGYVQGNIRGVYHTMQQGQEIGHDILYRIGDEHLVAVKLNLVLGHVQTVLDLGEIQDTGEVEGVVHIQMDVEQRFLQHRIELAVELHVVLLLQIGGLLVPDGVGIVDYLVLVGIHVLAVLPLLLLAEGDGHGHETAVFLQQLLHFGSSGELLGIVIQIQGYLGTPVGTASLSHGKLGIALALPSYGLCTLLP